MEIKDWTLYRTKNITKAFIITLNNSSRDTKNPFRYVKVVPDNDEGFFEIRWYTVEASYDLHNCLYKELGRVPKLIVLKLLKLMGGLVNVANDVVYDYAIEGKKDGVLDTRVHTVHNGSYYDTFVKGVHVWFVDSNYDSLGICNSYKIFLFPLNKKYLDASFHSFDWVDKINNKEGKKALKRELAAFGDFLANFNHARCVYPMLDY